VQLSALLEKRVKISDLLEDFKKHPVIQPLIRKGELVEYSAHLIPVSGLKMMPASSPTAFWSWGMRRPWSWGPA